MPKFMLREASDIAKGINADKLEEEEAKKKNINKARYKIIVKDKLGSTTRTIKIFYADRWIDESDYVVYLRNTKLNFLEIFPQKINDFVNYTEETIDTKLDNLRESLMNELKEDTEELNEEDIKYEIQKLEAKKRSFKFSDNASYISLSEINQPEIYYLREGSTFFPYKWDSDTRTIYTPSDNKKKNAAICLRNKELKYSKHQKTLQGAMIGILILNVIVLFGGGFTWYKAFTAYDDSNIAELQRSAEETTIRCSEVITEHADKFSNLLDKMGKQVVIDQTVVQGGIPQGIGDE